MEKRGWGEIIVVVVAIVIFVGLLIPSLLYARREMRDGIRRDEVAAFKTVLEQYYNKHEVYPLEFDASPHKYVVVKQANGGAASWYLRAKLENNAVEDEGFDAESGRNYYYRLINESGATYYDVCGGSDGCALEDVR